MSTIGLNNALGCFQTHWTLGILNYAESLAEMHIASNADTDPYFLESVKPRWKPRFTYNLVATGDRLTFVCTDEVRTLSVGIFRLLFETFTVSVTLFHDEKN